jgi:hypothetical protein
MFRKSFLTHMHPNPITGLENNLAWQFQWRISGREKGKVEDDGLLGLEGRQ